MEEQKRPRKYNNKNAKNVTLRIYRALKNLIISKRLASGCKINQNAMAEDYHVSRTPVINALHKLESEGLVDNIPNKGFFVHQITVKELLDLFALREALDTIVITELIETITKGQVARLEDTFQPFNLNKNHIDKKKYREADMQFHSLLLDFCKNDLAKRVNETFQILNRSYMAGLLRGPEETLGEHNNIIKALKEKNLEEARHWAVYHISKTKVMILEMLNNLRKIGVDPEKIPVRKFD
jgi:DNA-binding GntR family transcriptional regulator